MRGGGGAAALAAGPGCSLRPPGAPAIGVHTMTARANKLSPTTIAALALGLAFLYLPIVILVIYSFNASRLVSVWGGWSSRWYAALLADTAMLDSASVPLRIGVVSASAATVLGTLA